MSKAQAITILVIGGLLILLAFAPDNAFALVAAVLGAWLVVTGILGLTVRRRR